MSTKIYNGLKIPKDKLSEFTEWFFKYNFNILVKDVERRLSFAKLSDISWMHESYQKHFDNNLTYIGLYNALHMYFIYGLSHECGFNPDSFFHSYFKDNDCLIMPVYTLGANTYPKKNDLPPFAKPYGYWNNSDAEEKVSAKEWKQREEDWNYVIDYSVSNLSKLTYTFCDCKWYYSGALPLIEKHFVQDKLEPLVICEAAYHRAETILEKK